MAWNPGLYDSLWKLASFQDFMASFDSLKQINPLKLILEAF